MAAPLLTAGQLHAICDSQPRQFRDVDYVVVAAAFDSAMAQWGVTTAPARAALLAVCGEETRFRATRERTNYSPERMAVVWPRYRIPDTRPPEPTPEARRIAALGEQAVANHVYAYLLGNGGPESGDGWAFRGGGAIQITGKANWRACALAHGLVDPDDSELAGWADEVSSTPALSASSAAWFVSSYAKLLPLMNTGEERDFLTAASRVGMPPDMNVVALWKALWAKGVEVLS